ncbi:MAG: hypothetical protein ACXABY_31175 [Candidatus Thorarchaeota archaeon]|jgi:hypothetical protein
MKGGRTNLSSLMVVFTFVATGLFWIGTVAVDGSTWWLLFLGITNMLSAITVLAKLDTRYVRGIVVATSLYNLMLFIFQLIAAVALLLSGLVLFSVLTIIGYSAGTLIFLVILVLAYAGSEKILPPSL